VGGDAPIVVQSMTNTDTADAEATLAQIAELAELGCDIVRLAVPDKAAALAEMFRVLRSGGRAQLADIVLDRPVPGGSKADVSLWTGCIAGGLIEEDLRGLVQEAGFQDVEVRRGIDVFSGAPQHSDAAAFGTVGAGIVARRP
jgi:hypothetical protein